MSTDLKHFDAAMDELRAAYLAADGNQILQAEIKSSFDKTVVEKNRFLVGAIAAQAQALIELSAIVEAAVKSIQEQMSWFPLATLKSIIGAGDGSPGNGNTSAGGANSTTSDASIEVGNGTGSSADLLGANGIKIDVTAQDFDAICRVSQGEVGHFGKYGLDQLSGGLAAVVDTILNRVAHQSYPNSIMGVVDQPKQFSPINTVGTWTGLAKARPEVESLIFHHIEKRANGGLSVVGGATHFLNPYLSSSVALASWGNHVIANAVAMFGDDASKDVHYHGFAPGVPLPARYAISFQGDTAVFDGNGRANYDGFTSSNVAKKILEICKAEYEFFEKGNRKENDDPQYRRVGEYWGNLGLSFDGRTKLYNEKTKKYYNPAWSSAFIGYVIESSAHSSDFKSSQAHCHYIQDYVSRPSNGRLYRAMHPKFYAPKVGDIVHFGREWAKGFDYAEATAVYAADSFYPSHSDIVVEADIAANIIRTIGGNVSNSVSMKTFSVDMDGVLKDRTEDGKTYPWIAIISLEV